MVKNQTFSKDLRSDAVDQRRFKARQWKYYDFIGVNEGQIGKPHYKAEYCWPYCNPALVTFPANLEDCKVVRIDKRELYREAQLSHPWYKHRHKRPCPDKKDKAQQRFRAFGRTQGQKEAAEWSHKARNNDTVAVLAEAGDESLWPIDYYELGCYEDDLVDSWFANTVVEYEERDIDLLLTAALRRRDFAIARDIQKQGWSDADFEAFLSPEAAWVLDDGMSCSEISDFELL